MKKKGADFYLGLFVLAGLVTIGFMILRFGGWSSEEGYEVSVLFDNVEGLIKGAPVHYRGHECGKVKKITIEGAQIEGKIEVILSLSEGVVLRKGDEVRIRAVDLMGGRVVEIIPAPHESAPVPEGGAIVGSDSASLTEQAEQVMRELRVVANNVGDLARKDGPLVKATHGLEQFVGNTLPEVADAIRDLADGAKTLVEENGDKVNSLLVNVDGAAEGTRDLVEKLNSMTDEGGSVTETMDNIKDAAENFGHAAQRASVALEKTDRILTTVAEDGLRELWRKGCRKDSDAGDEQDGPPLDQRIEGYIGQ